MTSRIMIIAIFAVYYYSTIVYCFRILIISIIIATPIAVIMNRFDSSFRGSSLRGLCFMTCVPLEQDTS